MRTTFSKIYHTLIYLKPIQIYYQVWYRLRQKLFGDIKVHKPYKTVNPINWETIVHNPNSLIDNKTFEFLNIKHQFSNNIDWNYNAFGKLWTYNLNYFEFLNQKDISKQTGLNLIKHFVKNDAILKDGKEPYPISLRGINWIKFLSQHKINDAAVNQSLFNHYHILLKKLEYHLLANHLLENGFSLLFGAYYFKNETFYNKAYNIIKNQLNEQILNDGAHFELSPMYHKIIFSRVLDTIQLTKLNTWKTNDLHQFLIVKAQKMLSWLNHITYKNGSMPMFNDCANGIAPSYQHLQVYANYLNLKSDALPLSDSGYRKFVKHNFELFFDIGNILPSYQPSHNHADTFNFELAYNNQPIIVDKGTSTYQKNKLRHIERSTASHNTVTINNSNSSHVWGGFRVAQRAKVNILVDQKNKVIASHNGYKKKYGITHKRTFNFTSNELIINDEIDKGSATARFHFHPNIKPVIQNHSVVCTAENLVFKFKSETLAIVIKDYDFCAGFNKTLKAKVVEVEFSKKLTTAISAKTT